MDLSETQTDEPKNKKTDDDEQSFTPDLTRDLKKLRCMTVTMIPVVFSVLGTVPPWPGEETGEIEDQSKNRNHTN